MRRTANAVLPLENLVPSEKRDVQEGTGCVPARKRVAGRVLRARYNGQLDYLLARSSSPHVDLGGDIIKEQLALTDHVPFSVMGVQVMLERMAAEF